MTWTWFHRLGSPPHVYGLARRLMNKVIGHELARGETPFLHVMRDNESAQRLYEQLGFRVYREPVLRVIARC